MIGILVAAVGGLLVGSFLNVVVLRLQAGKSFVTGRSACPKCGHQLAWWENIPVFSWLGLGGRCRKCRRPISWQYPLVELVTAILFVLTFQLIQPEDALGYVRLACWLYIVSSCIVLAVYDLRWYLLPDKVLLPLIIPGLALAAINAQQTHQLSALTQPLLAAAIFGGGFYLIAAASKGRWMGGGDIKLAFVMGLCLGLQKTLLAMFIAFNSAAIVGLVLIGLRRKTRKDYLPFGPFLIGGLLVALLCGSTIINWYLASTGLNLL